MTRYFYNLATDQRFYIAGPMSGYPEFNFPAFDAAKEQLILWGYKVISPADLDRASGPFEDCKVEDCARRDLEALLEVDAVYALDGWEKSTGARNEVMVAGWLGLPVFSQERKGEEMRITARFAAGAELSGENRTFEDVFGRVDPEEISDEAINRHVAAVLDYTPEEIAEWKDHGGGCTIEEYHSDKGDTSWENYRKAWDIPPSEVRVTDPVTGGAKGQKRQRMDLLPYDTLMWISEHYAVGADKYDDRNWEKGYAWSLSMGALMRHLAAFWQGEDYDMETLSHHLQAVVFHALGLATFVNRNIGTDDRPGNVPTG